MPHRGVNAGKSRLSGVLNDMARGKLNRWLLARTLSVVTAWLGNAQRCVVVSPCEVTLALARNAGAVALAEKPFIGNALNAGVTGALNAALTQAAIHAAALGAQRLLILPCDLPLLSVGALQAMQAPVVAGNEMVIAPDRQHQGTNALMVDAGMRDFTFGKGSYQRHLALGKMYGACTVPCLHAALAFDLDTADDFAEWEKHNDVPREFLATLPRAAPHGVGFVSSRTK